MLAVELRRHHAHPEAVEAVEDDGVGDLGDDVDRVAVHRLGLAYRVVGVPGDRGRQEVLVDAAQEAVDAELHGFRVEGLAVVELHVLAQPELEGRVVHALPRDGEHGLPALVGIDRVAHVDEVLEHVAERALVVGVDVVLRVHGGARDPVQDDQRLLGLRPGAADQERPRRDAGRGAGGHPDEAPAADVDREELGEVGSPGVTHGDLRSARELSRTVVQVAVRRGGSGGAATAAAKNSVPGAGGKGTARCGQSRGRPRSLSIRRRAGPPACRRAGMRRAGPPPGRVEPGEVSVRASGRMPGRTARGSPPPA